MRFEILKAQEAFFDKFRLFTERFQNLFVFVFIDLGEDHMVLFVNQLSDVRQF